MSATMGIDRAYQTAAAAAQAFRSDVTIILKQERNIDLAEALGASNDAWVPLNIPDTLLQLSKDLRSLSFTKEAEAVESVHDKITTLPSHGGLGITTTDPPTPTQYTEALFQTKAWLHRIKSTLTSPSYLSTTLTPPPTRHPLNLPQKILFQHLHLPPSTHHPDTLPTTSVHRIGIDWILASELSLTSMLETHDTISSPPIFRPDRLWLAGDHIVHPTLLSHPKITPYITRAEKARQDWKLTEYQGMNYTIMHTEFVRERALPGQVVVGSDSHTCSAGAVGCLSMGLGTADTMLTAALGETWIRVPEVVRVDFVGRLGVGVCGKDVILGILGRLGRNTVAAERIVEFGGEGAGQLSVDARFAICNMCTEFGAITGVFVPDGVTRDYAGRRKRRMDREGGLFFRPDEGAEYAGRYEIDLSEIEHTVAVYPEPDNVVPVSEKAGLQLDGVFIGACTTTEEELVLAALVLQAGLQKGLPLAKGKRHYVPGSLPIVDTLNKLGLLQIYEQAGFTRGPPGCSLCVGLSAEKALEGETWLSSQNRNFHNRMGPGSIGHLSSAAVCAASAFSMSITSPTTLLAAIDMPFWEKYQNTSLPFNAEVTYVEPLPYILPSPSPLQPNEEKESALPNKITSKMTLLGDLIDTDALAPGASLTTCRTDAEFGQYCLKYTHPTFRSTVAAGHSVVVAGKAFGVGSSRECAVSALKGAGVQCVIARSFGFIFGRNLSCLGLLGFVVEDEGFWGVVGEGRGVSVDVGERVVWVEGVEGGSFGFVLSEIEEGLLRVGGIAESYKVFGKGMWESLMRGGHTKGRKKRVEGVPGGDERLEW